jgi:hypothetical protein
MMGVLTRWMTPTEQNRYWMAIRELVNVINYEIYRLRK